MNESFFRKIRSEVNLAMNGKEKFMRIPCSTLNIKYLKSIIKNLPDDMEIFVGCQGYTNYDFKRGCMPEDSDTFAIVHDGKLFITDECAIEIDENGNTI